MNLITTNPIRITIVLAIGQTTINIIHKAIITIEIIDFIAINISIIKTTSTDRGSFLVDVSLTAQRQEVNPPATAAWIVVLRTVFGFQDVTLAGQSGS